MKNELNRLANELRIYNDANLQDDWLLGLEQALRSLAALGAVPEGFVLVPARPTHAMREAAYKWHTTEYVSDPMGERNRFYGGIYSAMLAAAPQPAGEDGQRAWSAAMAEKEAGQYVGAGSHGIADEPAPSAPSPGDALSLDGAAGRSASRAPADVVSLADQADRIADLFDEHRKGLPDSWRDWAVDKSRALRKHAAACRVWQETPRSA